jgi:uracil-DNA glycosylase
MPHQTAGPLTDVTATLESDTDWPGFRREVQALLARLVPPERVSWHTRTGSPEGLIADATPARRHDTAHSGGINLVVPASFVTLCETVILCNDPVRFGLLYRLLWRLVHEPGLRRDPLDPDRVLAQHMVQAVRRDMHKMKADLRFRAIEDEAGSPLHVAWFEPEHHIVEAVAPSFVRRFAQTHWAILTPERSVRWNGGKLELGPGRQRGEIPAQDAGHVQWLSCYRYTFRAAELARSG